jgi:hypothetical protein
VSHETPNPEVDELTRGMCEVIEGLAARVASLLKENEKLRRIIIAHGLNPDPHA